MQTPSIGRIVIVPAEGSANNGAAEAPAIITRVWSETERGWTINVRVLLDSDFLEWRTSVTLCETEEQARATGQHCAWWPPRV